MGWHLASAKMTMITIAIITLSLSRLVGTATSYGEIRDIPDFQHNEEIQRLARFAVDEFNKRQHGDLCFSNVVRAQEQVVAGFMYYLTIEAASARRAPGLYAAKIWVVPWRNIQELQEFKAMQSPPHKDKVQATGWHAVPTDDSMVQEAAENAVKIIQQRSNSLMPYKLEKILSSKEEEINGLKSFNLLLRIKWENKVQPYEVEMKRSIDGEWTLSHIRQNANN